MITKAMLTPTLLACFLLVLFSRCGGGNAGQSFQVTRPTTDAAGAGDFTFDDQPASFQGVT